MRGRTVLWLLLLVLTATTLPGASPWAAWSGFKAIPWVDQNNSPLLLDSNVSCAPYAGKTADAAVCAAVGPDGQVLMALWQGGKWSALSVPPGGPAGSSAQVLPSSGPSCSGGGTDVVFCMFRDAYMAPVAYQYGPGGVQQASLIAGGPAFASALSCALAQQTTVVCVGRTFASTLAAVCFDCGAALGWSLAGGGTGIVPSVTSVLSPPSCAPDGTGYVYCAWLTTGAAVSAIRFDSSGTASAWGNLGGQATNPPACANGGVARQLACVITGTDSSLYINECCNASTGLFGNWDAMEGEVHSYDCASYGNPASDTVQYACGVIGLVDSGFWDKETTGGAWTSHGGTFVGQPSCVTLTISKLVGREVMCVLVKQNGQAVSTIGP